METDGLLIQHTPDTSLELEDRGNPLAVELNADPKVCYFRFMAQC